MRRPGLSSALTVYDLLWRGLPVVLKRNKRLREGWDERLLKTPLPRADIWLQAASAGEAYLARTILAALSAALPQGARVRALVTTNTRQGRDLLERAAGELADAAAAVTLLPAYCPFDRPSLMRKAFGQVMPRCLVLLETEIWPGLLAAAAGANVPVVIANARMSPKTLARNLPFANLLRPFGPAEVLAISEKDAARFATLFPAARTKNVSNVKFDQLTLGETPKAASALASLLPEQSPFVVLGSVREQEEEQAARAAADILAARPDAVIGLFPRHMERLAAWEGRLAALGLPVVRRSALTGRAMPGATILWDVFGELTTAYFLSGAVFVGGSLAPLGGQNFLEPLAAGLVPVSGPYWKNFAWVGREIVQQGLLREVPDGRALAGALLDLLDAPRPREEVREAFAAYVATRRGAAGCIASRLAERLGFA
ncbi:Three-deoxy-D-manno-octulosonic-acid transferase domain-containing protein [Desulfovibrio sp. X2]|uniref:3-deoxy-D-manno-octulosonic acid transferase n=1 Tax=Desulfovibrio sp. X2 TaxID=941449 RepID=UPI000358F337|nr:glycosyltransferase N-terminal domain-containing protein [Desulfovibrio sp. X2]EPR42424.1 Three-deoxy-D-manno-octulosonic-acid transferase domain-containing protein [Desulfovibrio sp. X2]